LLLLGALFLACVAAQKTWTVDSTSSATTLVGVGAASANMAVAAAASNGIGALVETYNGTKWTKRPVSGGLLLDGAITSTGVTVATSMLGILISTDGKEFVTAAGVGGISQSANVYGANGDKLALVGSWITKNPDDKYPTSVSGVASSSDSGATWQLSANVPVGYVRYGAFPTDSTWYISSGMWSDAVNRVLPDEKSMSSRFKFDKKNPEKVSFIKPSGRYLKKYKTSEPTGWFGAVSKTTDGGKTWTQVFTSDMENDYFYFNGISCPSENHCVVVGEGDDGVGGSLNVAFTTFDGGVTWDRTLTAADASMMGVDFINDNEGWAAGTAIVGRNLVAQFHHTTDGGRTFKVEDTLTNCFLLDLDIASDGTGIAACASSSGSSCFAALYR